jgi:hypothetical protein
MAKTGKPRGRAGRARTGLHGELASQYPRVTLRLPPGTLADLDAIARAIGHSQWRVIVEAVSAFLGERPVLNDAERRAVQAIRRVGSSS